MPFAPEHIKTIGPHVELYRDPETGIAWAENGSTGISHSVHPNIDKTGSVKGMISRGYWPPNAAPVASGNWIYNTTTCLVEDDIDAIVAEYCQCGGNHGSCQDK